MKEIIIKIEVEDNEDDYYNNPEYIKKDLRQEISCCTLDYEIKDISIKDN